MAYTKIFDPAGVRLFWGTPAGSPFLPPTLPASTTNTGQGFVNNSESNYNEKLQEAAQKILEAGNGLDVFQFRGACDIALAAKQSGNGYLINYYNQHPEQFASLSSLTNEEQGKLGDILIKLLTNGVKLGVEYTRIDDLIKNSNRDK